MTIPRRMRAAIWAALAVGTSLAAPLLREHPIEGGMATALAITPGTYEFGSVRAGAPIKVEFGYTNDSDVPVRILDVHGTCGCVKAEASSRYVEPGGKGTLTATISTAGRQGPQMFRILLKTDEGRRGGATLTIKGEIRIALRPRPTRVSFGAVVPGSEQHAEVRVEKLEPVEAITITCQGEGLSAEKVAEDTKGLTLRIDLKAPWAKGVRGNGVTVTAAEGFAWIPVSWHIPPPFELSSRRIEFRGGKGEIVAKPAWPAVSLAQVNVHSLPIDVTRDGDRITLTLRDPAFTFPPGATIELVPEPAALATMRVPLHARPD